MFSTDVMMKKALMDIMFSIDVMMMIALMDMCVFY